MTVVEREVVAPVVTERERRARVLEGAALEIEVRGWTTGDGECPTGAVCLLGAIARATDENPNASYLWDDYAAYFGAPVFQIGMFPRDTPAESLYGWNDQECRTAEQVTFLLRWRAAEIRDGL